MPDFPLGAETTHMTKIALRNYLLTKRRRLSRSDLQSAAAVVQAATTTLIRRHPPSTTAAYVPVGPEPGGVDLPEVLAGALPPGATLLLPVLLDDGDLDWAVYTGPGSLAPGPRGLREPTGARIGVDAIRDVDLCLVPALAVSRTGLRMGRGGGSYDRALARITAARVVALLHDGELRDEVPAEPHDRRVHAVITPTTGLLDMPARPAQP